MVDLLHEFMVIYNLYYVAFVCLSLMYEHTIYCDSRGSF